MRCNHCDVLAKRLEIAEERLRMEMDSRDMWYRLYVGEAFRLTSALGRDTVSGTRVKGTTEQGGG